MDFAKVEQQMRMVLVRSGPAIITHANGNIHCAVTVQRFSAADTLIRLGSSDPSAPDAHQAVGITKIVAFIADLQTTPTSTAIPLMTEELTKQVHLLPPRLMSCRGDYSIIKRVWQRKTSFTMADKRGIFVGRGRRTRILG